MATTSRYSKSLPKDDIKRLSKEVTKKLVRGDFKAGRVKDPTAPISSKHEKTVKSFVKEFMDKAVKKKEGRERDKGSRDGKEAEGDVLMSVEKDISPADSSGGELKRKREEEGAPASPKKFRPDAQAIPPPPPPPLDDMPTEADTSTLTPMDDDPVSIHSTSDHSLNGIRPKTLDSLASPTQLATPPTKEAIEYRQQVLAVDRKC